MSRLFIEGLHKKAGLACVSCLILLQGCATTSAPEKSISTGAAVQAGAQVVENKPETVSSWMPQTEAVEEPAPPVKRHNLAAFEDALLAMQEGRIQEAEVLLQEITAEQPELAGPWVNLGQVYVSLERFDDARVAFRNAIDANPGSCHAYNQLGVLSRQVGDFQGAEKLYQACLKRVPGFKDAYLNLGILYELYLGKLPEALAAYRQYQSLSQQPNRKVLGWVMDLERRLGV